MKMELVSKIETHITEYKGVMTCQYSLGMIVDVSIELRDIFLHEQTTAP
jgi:hypothetical protein